MNEHRNVEEKFYALRKYQEFKNLLLISESELVLKVTGLYLINNYKGYMNLFRGEEEIVNFQAET